MQADRQGPFVVVVVNPENKIDVQRIETGDTLDRGNVAVRSGLEPGERVVVQGIQRVQPGTLVTPRPVEQASAAAER